MLVLSRETNETIILTIPGRENRVTIRVVEIRHGDKVKIGIDADRDITCHRGEIQRLVDAENGASEE